MTTIALLPTEVLVLVGGLLGSLIGSFLNVVTHRLPAITLAEIAGETAEMSLSFPGSHCPQCDSTLAWYENIPLLSFLVQAGKCRHCHVAIPWRYPLLEILGGVAGAIAVWRFGFTVEGALAAGFLLSLIALSAIDLETGLLPDRLTLPLVWVGLAGAALGFGPNAAQAILGAALGYVLLEGLNRLCVLTIGRDGFGGGDGKLAAAMGAWLGLSSLPLALFIAFATGAIYGLGVRLLISRKSGVRADDSNEIPFGPWLAVGAVILMLWPGMAAMAADWLIYGTL